MKVIKKINNNAAVCVDSAGHEVVAIGFPAIPYILTDLSKVQRTYYDINPMYLDLLNQISSKIFTVSAQIVEEFRLKVNREVSSNLVFTLADHSHLAIARWQNNLQFDNFLHYEVQHLYETEYAIGLQAIKWIQQTVAVRLPDAEATNIALHLINAEKVATKASRLNHFERILTAIVELIAAHFDLYIDKNSVSYSRFVSHLQYLLKREQKGEKMASPNQTLFASVIQEYPQSYEAVLKIKHYLANELTLELSDEEVLYLILHVNRLCVREEHHHQDWNDTTNCE